MTAKVKKQKKLKYDAGDFLELERHLSARHADGHQFCGVTFCNRPQFVPCSPGEYTYRLDFIPKGMEREDYLSRLRAEGWFHCGTFRGWQCLRRAGNEALAPDGVLLHNDLERGKWGRARADREALIGILPMAVCYFAGCLLKDTAYASALWKLATLFLIVAVAEVLPVYQVRIKCGRVMTQWYQAQGQTPPK